MHCPVDPNKGEPAQLERSTQGRHFRRMARCDAEIQALEERKRYWENQQEAAWAKLTELCEPNEHWYMAELDKLNTKYPSLRFSCDGAYVREQS